MGEASDSGRDLGLDGLGEKRDLPSESSGDLEATSRFNIRADNGRFFVCFGAVKTNPYGNDHPTLLLS